jgi:acyl-coenzyme A thioesterase PaaI-like protein
MKLIANPYETDGTCFFCGSRNPVGLKLAFHETQTEPNELVCKWIPSAAYKGFGRVLHGGIQSGLFDEIMGWTTLHISHEVGVTASLNVEFLRPLYVEQEIEVRCRVGSQNGSRLNLLAEIRNAEGELCSRATGTYVLMEQDRFKSLVE